MLSQSCIGKEFEKLIDSHGPDHVKDLMQKVINALEHLEKLSSERDSEKSMIDCLQNTITHLELEDNKKLEERQRNARVGVTTTMFTLCISIEFFIRQKYMIHNQLSML